MATQNFFKSLHTLLMMFFIIKNPFLLWLKVKELPRNKSLEFHLHNVLNQNRPQTEVVI